MDSDTSTDYQAADSRIYPLWRSPQAADQFAGRPCLRRGNTGYLGSKSPMTRELTEAEVEASWCATVRLETRALPRVASEACVASETTRGRARLRPTDHGGGWAPNRAAHAPTPAPRPPSLCPCRVSADDGDRALL
jgi:hypothetical protein